MDQGNMNTTQTTTRTMTMTTTTSPANDNAGPAPEDEAVLFDVGRIARLYGSYLQRKALRLTHDSAAAWDILQETYERALRTRPACISDRKALAWLTVVMRNLHCDQVRSRRRRHEVEGQSLEQFPCLEPDPTPAWAELTLETIQESLPAISASLRPAYELHALQGCSYAEIATRLQLPTATVGTRLLRARKQLRRALDRTAAHAA
jgi:RNA polymerase sigma-70 factor (ECF subfamily)